MDKPNKCLIDGDLMAYKAACFADKEGIDELEDRLRFDVELWTPEGCDATIAFSCKRSDNYRRDFWPAYKANRDGKPGPESLPRTIEMLKDMFHSVSRPRLEADDLMGMAMGHGTHIAVTLDKDLRTCPGWLWNPEKQGFPELISEEEADQHFFKQWLTGDGTDGIPGLHRMGPKTALKILESNPRSSWSAVVQQIYADTAEDFTRWQDRGKRFEGTRAEMLEKRYGWTQGQDLEFCLAQARCVRILRAGEYDSEAGEPILWTP